jgi:hypothetical protein
MFKRSLIATAVGAVLAPLAASAALITSAGDPALSGSTLINFDSEPTENFTSKAIVGVTFSTAAGTLRNAPYTEGGVYGGSGQDLSTRDLASPEAFRIDFSIPVSAFGMVWGAADYDWTVRVFNSSGINIETLTFCGSTVGCAAGTGYEKFYGATGADISYVTLETTSGDWVKIDDFQFAAGAATGSLAFNPKGIGHIQYVPYFSTQEGNVTAVSIVNTDTVNGKVLKVRFRGASNSDDVYDFQVFLSPGDVWTAGIAQGSDGRSRLDTADKSCTLPANVNGAFITSRTPAAGGVAETREGYIEILTMADIVQGSPGSDQRALYTATKHVKAVAPCTASVLTALTHENASDYMAPPTTGIMANWSIINVNRIVAYSGAAAAIEARDAAGEAGPGRLVYWDQRSVPLSVAQANANTADPLLRGASPAIVGARYDLPDLSTPYLPDLPICPFCQARALSDAIAAQEIAAEYYNEASLGAQTDVVVSFPTRRYFAAVKYGTPNTIVRNATSDGNIYFTADNTELGNAANGGQPWQICARLGVNAVAFYDREETPTVIDDIVISPGTPTSLSICGEVTVVGVNNTSASDSATFGSVARSNVANGFTAGWGSLTVPSENGLPMLARQFLRINNTQTNVYYGMSFPARVVVPGFPAPFVPAP